MNETIAAPFVVRRATPADREAICEVSRAVDPDDYIPYIVDDLIQAAEPGGLYVAELAGRVIACHALDWPVPQEAYLFAMRVRPEMQGRGIGSAYCRAQVEHAVGLGARKLFLTSVVKNVPAHRAVEKNGFVNRGEWIIHEEMPGLPAVPGVTGGAARPAQAADLPLLEALWQGAVLSDVIAVPDEPYGLMTMWAEDWALADLAVVDGQNGLAGAMLLRQTADGQLYIRRLEGTPDAAAELLAYAAAEGARRGLTKWCVSVPARCEHLLAPVGVKPEDAFRTFVFQYTA